MRGHGKRPKGILIKSGNCRLQSHPLQLHSTQKLWQVSVNSHCEAWTEQDGILRIPWNTWKLFFEKAISERHFYLWNSGLSQVVKVMFAYSFILLSFSYSGADCWWSRSWICPVPNQFQRKIKFPTNFLRSSIDGFAGVNFFSNESKWA